MTEWDTLVEAYAQSQELIAAQAAEIAGLIDHSERVEAERDALRAEIERLKHCVATMTPTEAYKIVYAALEEALAHPAVQEGIKETQ